jgi:hypothetical protein
MKKSGQGEIGGAQDIKDCGLEWTTVIESIEARTGPEAAMKDRKGVLTDPQLPFRVQPTVHILRSYYMPKNANGRYLRKHPE